MRQHRRHRDSNSAPSVRPAHLLAAASLHPDDNDDDDGDADADDGSSLFFFVFFSIFAVTIADGADIVVAAMKYPTRSGLVLITGSRHNDYS